MKIQINAAVTPKLQGFFQGIAVIGPVKVEKSGEAFLSFVGEKISELRQRYRLETLKDEPLIRTYRQFYWSLGIDPTKVRPSSEALVRRSLQGAAIPKINNVVDAYNLASMETLIPMGAFDMDLVRLPITMRYGKIGENFVKIDGFGEALTGKELILSDFEKVINIYPHRDSDFTKVTFKTQKVLLIIAGVLGVSREEVISATEKTCEYITHFAGGEYEQWIQAQQT